MLFTVLFICLPLLVVLVCCVAIGVFCFAKKYRWVLFVLPVLFPCLLVSVASIWFLSSLYPSYVYDEADIDVPSGTYVIDVGESSRMLCLAKVEGRDAQIEFDSSGGFVVTHIPACCLFDTGPTSLPFTSGVCDASGKWRIYKKGKIYGIILDVTDVKFVGAPPDEFKPKGTKSLLPYKPVWIDLLSGNPNSLGFGFSIWGGSGMDDVEDHAIVFSKGANAIAEPRPNPK